MKNCVLQCEKCKLIFIIISNYPNHYKLLGMLCLFFETKVLNFEMIYRLRILNN